MIMQNKKSYERYQRQLILKGFGEPGQDKLAAAKVLVVGAGGLGTPALLYLAAAGLGTIGVVDDDRVALHNLHRQPVYTMQDIGKPKVECIKIFLGNLNPEVKLISYAQRLMPSNALEIMEPYDIIIDGTDNFSSRYLINDACVLLNKPLVFGAVSKYEGQVAVFNADRRDEEPVNYRDLFPEPPAEREVANCAEAGVLGVLPGIIGTMQALETIKWITGIGQPLVNRLYIFNALNNQGFEMILKKKEGSGSWIPSDAEAFRKTDYEILCENGIGAFDITVEEFDGWLGKDKVRVIDVREFGEEPAAPEFGHEQIPLSRLRESFTMNGEERILFFCQSGSRSAEAARWIADLYGTEKKVYSLRGGILSYKNHHG
jgi:sulfur-carrier protein adenylyltransferase/sulfurtransferase